jgi:protein-S-isoprenylcysteine O-methyltransferase Ste14
VNDNLFRIFAALVLIGSGSISIYYRRKANVDSGETVSTQAENQFIFLALRLTALTLFVGMVTYVIYPPWLDWSKIGIPESIRWLGVGIGLAGVGLCYWVFSSIGQGISTTVAIRKQAKLITSGPYHWVRHPLYVVGLATFGSIGMIAANWFIMSCVVLAFILLVIRTYSEEEHLIANFGDEYRDYMKRTGRFLPKIF